MHKNILFIYLSRDLFADDMICDNTIEPGSKTAPAFEHWEFGEHFDQNFRVQ